ncbi:MAG TPA: type II secretion system protein N [Rhodanobacter sp.]
MKYLRKGLLGLGVLVLAALLLVWFLPARWIVPRLESRLHGLRLEQISGSVWNGSAGQVRDADGRVMGKLQWQLSRLALIGRVSAQWRFDGPQFGLSGSMKRLSADQTELSAVNMHVELALLDRRMTTPFGQPRGELQLHVDRALLQGGWPLQLRSNAQWHHAAMQTSDGLVPLGELLAEATAQGGVIQAQLHDDGRGPLEVMGQLQVIPLGWRMDVTLRARRADPVLSRWLDQLGSPDSDGRIHIQRNGGLTGSSPASVADSHHTGQP